MKAEINDRLFSTFDSVFTLNLLYLFTGLIGEA